MQNNSRNLGLDIVRSTAIICVLLSHLRMFVYGNLQYLSTFGFIGVEIFFVLSGFLIGKIIINGIVQNPTLKTLRLFYIRRWMRTLPLYYLVLLLTMFIFNKGIPALNLIFLQNFNEQSLSFLAVSWSLSIEEWFYLLFPLILLIVLKLNKDKYDKKIIFFATATIFALISFSLRGFIVMINNPEYDYGVRKQIFLRMDAMMFGVVLAGIKHYYKVAYLKIFSKMESKIAFIITWLLVFYIYIKMLGSGTCFDSRFYKIFLFSLVSLSSAIFIGVMDNSNFINKTLDKFKISSLFRFISKLSYSIYLTHHIIFTKVATVQQGFKGLIIALLISLTTSIFLYYAYENQILKVRDKISI